MLVQVGQAVAATGAGYAQYAIMKAAMCFPINEASAEAVAVCLSGLTAAGALLVRNLAGGIQETVTMFLFCEVHDWSQLQMQNPS